jgi:hypothetical protein
VADRASELLPHYDPEPSFFFTASVVWMFVWVPVQLWQMCSAMEEEKILCWESLAFSFLEIARRNVL